MRENLHGTVDTLLPHRMFTFPSLSLFPRVFRSLFATFCFVVPFFFFIFSFFFFFNRSLGEAKNARYFFFNEYS